MQRWQRRWQQRSCLMQNGTSERIVWQLGNAVAPDSERAFGLQNTLGLSIELLEVEPMYLETRVYG